ncbi:hypothetical protein C3L33_18095, partial [Rhododendron williamsianum]
MWGLEIVAVVVAECVEVGLNTMSKAAMRRGMNNFIYSAYSTSLGVLFLVPLAFFFHRYCVQMCMYLGIQCSSPTLASALTNLTPAFTFILARISGDHSRHLLPEGFVESTESLGKVVSWAPQSQVLAHPSVGVFVSHGGWNSILESVAGGVPMICRPFFGDQTLNSRMVQDVWQIGIRVEGGAFTRSGTSSALELVLSREEGKEMREIISGLKESAVDAVGPSGRSTANFETLVESVAAANEESDAVTDRLESFMVNLPQHQVASRRDDATNS